MSLSLPPFLNLLHPPSSSSAPSISTFPSPSNTSPQGTQTGATTLLLLGQSSPGPLLAVIARIDKQMTTMLTKTRKPMKALKQWSMQVAFGLILGLSKETPTAMMVEGFSSSCCCGCGCCCCCCCCSSSSSTLSSIDRSSSDCSDMFFG